MNDKLINNRKIIVLATLFLIEKKLEFPSILSGIHPLSQETDPDQNTMDPQH